MNKALIVVDMQNSFCHLSGGLYVDHASVLPKKIYDYMTNATYYKTIVATKDWHFPGDNSGHIADNPDYVDSWPEHCIGGTWGCNFTYPLRSDKFDDVFKKGRGIPAYSGFQGVGKSGLLLQEYLVSQLISHVDIVGVALDYCVKATALDAARLGFKTRVLTNYTVAVGDREKSLNEMFVHGITLALA